MHTSTGTTTGEGLVARFEEMGGACGVAVSPSRDIWITHLSGDSELIEGPGDFAIFCTAEIWAPLPST